MMLPTPSNIPAMSLGDRAFYDPPLDFRRVSASSGSQQKALSPLARWLRDCLEGSQGVLLRVGAR